MGLKAEFCGEVLNVGRVGIDEVLTGHSGLVVWRPEEGHIS